MRVVTIIVPCFNYGWLLGETLDSILAQTHQAWECIVIDDGSTDNTREVVARYQAIDPRFQYVYQANGGMSAARNHGLRLAQGNFIQFLDADDLILPRKLEIQSAFLDNNINVDIVYGDVRYFKHEEPLEFSRSFDMKDVDWMVPLRGNGVPVVSKIIEANLLVMNAPLLRASIIKKVGDFSIEMRAMEDWEFWVRCAVANAYFYNDDNPDAWTLVRVHPTSASQNHAKMLTYMEKVRVKLTPYLDKLSDKSIIARNQLLLEELMLENAKYNIKEGDLIDGISGFVKLAISSGRYSYYLKSIVYWLRLRI